ncbi:hypothetical protein Tco_0055723, partial [Tanacetum coccineum]
NAINADEDITLVNVQDNADNEMFDVDALNDEEVFVVEQEVANEKDDDGEITLAQAHIEIKSTKPKMKGVVIQDPGESTTTKSSQQSQDKGKGIMIKEPVKPMKKKHQINFDEEVALKLQAEFDEEERLTRENVEKEKEANIALTEEWDDIQAKIKADHELAQILQAEEQEELSVEEKNMEGKKLKGLKNKSFDSIQKMFNKAFKRVNTFVDFRTDLVEELQSLMEVIPDEEEVAIDVVPLAVKSLSIVGWKIYKE